MERNIQKCEVGISLRIEKYNFIYILAFLIRKNVAHPFTTTQDAQKILIKIFRKKNF